MATELIVTSLKQSLSTAGRIPTDIQFQFEAENDCMSNMKEVRAHKLILGLVSDVFEKQFFGSDIREESTVVIKDATKDAFEAMINFIYNVNIDMNIYNFEILCSLYNLGEKYNIKAIKNETFLAISNKDIPEEEILGVCVLTDQYSVHEELKEALQKAIAQSLSKIFEGDLNKAIDFFAQNDKNDKPISAKTLAQILARLKKRKSRMCHYCRSSPCLTGVGLTRENFVPGAKVSDAKGLNITLHSLDVSTGFFDAVVKRKVLTYYLSPNWHVYNCR